VKIRTAIFGMYVAASAVGFAILMAFVLREVRVRYIESMQRTLNDTASLLAVFIEGELERQPESADLGAVWRNSLPAFGRVAGTLRVYITDARGVVVFDAKGGQDVGRDYSLRPEMRAPLRQLYDGAEGSGVVDGELRVAALVEQRGVARGFVGVARPLSSVTEAVFRARQWLAAGSLMVAAVLVAAGWWIAGRLTHSLERLTAYAQAVRDGRPALPPGSRAAEIAALVRAFEEMRIALEGKAYVERYTQALAHEFKAPLSAIRGAAELLAENPPEPDRARFLANLRAESARLQQIVERLLELAALESRRSGTAMAQVDLADVVRETREAARVAAAERGITLEADLSDAPRVRGERFLLVQAVGNLVQNAIEFSPRDATVTLRLRAVAGRAVVTVEDRGEGVPDYAQEKIFDRFYSLPRPDTGRKSSGIGLSIVREVARLHGGDVTLENREEGGARATLTLPLG